MLDLLSFIGNSISEVMLILGVISILIFLYTISWQYSILGFGIFSIISSVLIELNKQKANRQQRR